VRHINDTPDQLQALHPKRGANTATPKLHGGTELKSKHQFKSHWRHFYGAVALAMKWRIFVDAR
jgi:hypothetical protein